MGVYLIQNSTEVNYSGLVEIICCKKTFRDPGFFHLALSALSVLSLIPSSMLVSIYIHIPDLKEVNEEIQG